MDTNTERTNAHIARVLDLLNVTLPNDVNGLKSALRDVEVCYIGIVTARVQAHADLCNMRERYRHPKDKELTDMDRKTMLEAHTAEEQARFEQLAGIEKALEQRISVIRALLVQ